MKRQELDAKINNGALPNAMMFFGDSHFLIDRYARQLSRIEDANVLTFYHDEYDFNAAKAHLSQGSLFGDRNVLVIKNEKKVPKKELDLLIEFCKKNPDNIFVYAYYGSDFKTSNKAFTPKAGGDSVRLFNPFFNEAKNIILQEAQALGIRMDHNTAAHLLLAQNNDLGLACNELEKLRILDHPVTSTDVDNLVFGLAEVKLDQLIGNLLQKKEFRSDLQRILESGEDEIRILTAISGFVTQLYLFYAYIKMHGVPNSAEVLGYKLPAYIEKERAQLAIRFKQHTYTELINLLLDAELTMKSSGSVDKHAILLSTLIRLQSIL